MLTSHSLLLKYRHDPRCSFDDIGVWYVDRGTPGDHSWAYGPDIRSLESQYFEVTSNDGVKCIPYHRIRRITCGGSVIWERYEN